MPVVAGFIPTAEGRAALETAIEESRRRASRLVVLVHAGRGAEHDTLQTASAEAAQRLDGTDLDHEIRTLERGADVADGLIEAAANVGAGVIVIGLRRRSPVGKLILGLNAQRILLDAPCPVLAVKPAPTA